MVLDRASVADSIAEDPTEWAREACDALELVRMMVFSGEVVVTPALLFALQPVVTAAMRLARTVNVMQLHTLEVAE